MRACSFGVSFSVFLVSCLASVGASQEEQKPSEVSEAYANLTVLGKVLDYARDQRSVSIECETGAVLKLSVIRDDVVRMQVAPQGRFDDSLMIRWGYVCDNQPPVEFVVKRRQGHLEVLTKSLRVTVQTDPCSINFYDQDGRSLLEGDERAAVSYGRKTSLRFRMPADEHFFGFGFMRATFDARGTKLSWVRGHRSMGATVPFFMSTRGYGFYSNNTWIHHFDFTDTAGDTDKGSYRVSTAGGQIDCYFIGGPTFRDILRGYADLTGHSWLVPRWAFGLQFRNRYWENQDYVLEIARTFREKEIPCDIMALEPGWEDKPYSMKWTDWSRKRFPDPQKFIRELQEMGYQLDLWESGKAPFSNWTVSAVRDEWYDLRRGVVDQGVRMFKQDDPYPRGIVSKELEEPRFTTDKVTDEKFARGELDNIANSLYSDTLFTSFRKQTGQRAIVMFHAYNASVASHRWPLQWAGDYSTGYGPLNASLSGHAMVSYDLRDQSPGGIHNGFLSPFTVINSWAYFREPWIYTRTIEESHRRNGCLRSRLVPYLYSSLRQAHVDGVPIVRPMVLDYTDDSNTYFMGSQYMLGDWLLVDLTKSSDVAEGDTVTKSVEKLANVSPADAEEGRIGRVYLPAGKWIDYWMGHEVHRETAGWVEGSWPKYMGGMIWVKAGAIIPMGQVKNYEGEKKDEIVVLDAFPDGTSSYQLYEDDGLSYHYEKGEYATTRISSRENAEEGRVRIEISQRQGQYEGMPMRRSYLLKVHAKNAPRQVRLDGTELPKVKTIQELLYSQDVNGWSYYAEEKKAIIKLDSGWAYADSKAGRRPISAVPPTSRFERIIWNDDAKPVFSSRTLTLQMPTKPVLQFARSVETLAANGKSKVILNVSAKEQPAFQGEARASLQGPGRFANATKSTVCRFSQGKASLEIIAGDKAGLLEVNISGGGIEDGLCAIPIHGTASKIVLEAERTAVLTGRGQYAEVSAMLLDSSGRKVSVSETPVEFYGKRSDKAGLAEPARVLLADGKAVFKLASQHEPGTTEVWAKCGGLKSKPLQIESVVGEFDIRLNPSKEFEPEAVRKDGKSRTNALSIFVGILANGKPVETVSPEVTITLLDSSRKQLWSRTRVAANGEHHFTGLSYHRTWESPARYFMIVSSPGMKSVEKRLFENSWSDDWLKGMPNRESTEK